MPNLVLLKRSIMLDNRSIITYVFRFLLVGTILFVLIDFQQSYQTMRMISAIGRKFFMFVTNVNLIIITLAGLSFYSSAVTEEKEDQTLPLLMMTGMSPLNFLAGKFFSRLAAGCTLLLAQIPFTVLAVTFGGISIIQIINVYIALGAYLVFLCGLAILCSTIASNNRSASLLTFLGLLVFYGGNVIAYWVLNILYNIFVKNDYWRDRFFIIKWFYILPFHRVFEICQTGFAGNPLGIQFWSNLLLGLLFFMLAWKLFYRYSRKLSKNITITKKGRKKYKIRSHPIFKPDRTWTNAIRWKEFHFGLGGKWAFFVKCLFYIAMAIFFICFITFKVSFDSDILGKVIIVTGTISLAVELIAIASTIFNQELKWKTLSSITVLPCSITKLAYSKVIGSLPVLFPVLTYILFGFLLDLTLYGGKDLHKPFVDGDFWFVVIFFLFFLHLLTSFSLRVKSGSWALAGIICFIIMFIMEQFGAHFFIYWIDSSIAILITVIGITLLMRYIFGSWSQAIVATLLIVFLYFLVFYINPIEYGRSRYRERLTITHNLMTIIFISAIVIFHFDIVRKLKKLADG